MDPGGLGIEGLPLLLLDISPVAVSAGTSSVCCIRSQVDAIQSNKNKFDLVFFAGFVRKCEGLPLDRKLERSFCAT